MTANFSINFRNHLDGIKFGKANSKLRKLAAHLGVSASKVVQFDLPAGWTCPRANECKGRYYPDTGKVVWSDTCRFKCYAIKAEVQYPATAPARWSNFNELRNAGSAVNMANLLLDNLSDKVRVVRIHSSGDFYSDDYFQAWRLVAARRPNTTFFAYTKVSKYVGKYGDNFAVHYSHGGLDDTIAADMQYATCYVVTSREQAYELGVPLACDGNDYDDFHFIMNQQSFALLVH